MANIRDDLASGPGEAIDPVELARRDQKKALPKRFYKLAAFEAEENGYALILDGKRARTPARQTLAVPTRELAAALAEEWNRQEEFIDPAEMPLTRLINSALDGVAREMAATAAEILKYAGSDLLCYRAVEPERLVADQSAHWDPLLGWLRETTGAQLALAEGIVFVEQPPAAMASIATAISKAIGLGVGAPLRAAALNVITTLTGSAIIALALANGTTTTETGWAAAHVDEDFQISNWGSDSEAEARRARRWRDMEAAAFVLAHTPV